MVDLKEVAVVVEPVIEHKDFADPETQESVKNLLLKMKFLKKGFVSNPPVPVLENVYFKNGVMYCYDLSHAFAYKTEIKGEFLVPFRHLYDILTKIKDKSTMISFSLNTNSSMSSLYMNGKKSFEFPADHIADFPIIRMPKTPVGEFTENDIKSIKSLVPFASNDDLRPAMTGVYIEKGSFATTDGHRLGVRNAELGITQESVPFIMPKKAMVNLNEFDHAYIKRFVAEGEEDVLSEIYSVSDTHKAIIFRIINEKYPDYRNVLPDKYYVHISVNRHELMEVIDLALISANKTTHQIRILPVEEKNTMFLHSEDLDFSHKFDAEITAKTFCLEQERYVTLKNEDGTVKLDEEKQPVQEKKMVMQTPFEFGVNGKLLLDILKSLTNDMIIIKGNAANKGLMIDDTVLIMPVMLNQYS